MKVIFTGSLDIHAKDFEIVKENFKSLVKTLAYKDVWFVIRDVVQENINRIPIDYLVHEALEEYCKDGSKLSKRSLVVFKEPGISSGNKVILPHITHSATTSYRIDFYKELLDLVDIVIGVGGEFGLLRLTMLCEWIRKPILFLPGAGGSTDFLWQEFFKKSYQTMLFNYKQILKLKQTPMINEHNPAYSDTMYDLIQMVKETVEKGIIETQEFITPNNISITTLFSSLKKFSLGLWVLIISIIISLCSLAYYAGDKGFFKKDVSKTDVDDKKIYRKVP